MLLQAQNEAAQELKEQLTQTRLDQAEMRSQLEAKIQQLLEAQKSSGKTAADAGAEEVRNASNKLLSTALWFLTALCTGLDDVCVCHAKLDLPFAQLLVEVL